SHRGGDDGYVTVIALELDGTAGTIALPHSADDPVLRAARGYGAADRLQAFIENDGVAMQQVADTLRQVAERPATSDQLRQLFMGRGGVFDLLRLHLQRNVGVLRSPQRATSRLEEPRISDGE